MACSTEAEASSFIEALRSDPNYTSADHNMSAYRIWLAPEEQVDSGKAATNALSAAAQKGRWVEEVDDDGEGGGSRRILTDMQRLDAINVCVIVSRWYGGQNLGGARFRHIVSTARGVLSKLGYGEQAAAESDSGSSSDSGGEGEESGRQKKPKNRTFFDRTGVVSQGGEARRPSGVDKQVRCSIDVRSIFAVLRLFYDCFAATDLGLFWMNSSGTRCSSHCEAPHGRLDVNHFLIY